MVTETNIEPPIALPIALPIAQTINSSESWIKQHERILIVALVLLVGGWLTNKYLDNVAKADTQKALVAQQQLSAQKAANDKLNAQSQQTAEQYQALVTSLTAQNAKLSASISSRNTALITQQTQDKTLSYPDLAMRWTMLTNTKLTDVASDGTNFVVTPEAAQQTVIQLDSTNTLTQNVTDLQTEETNTKNELTTANQLIGEQKNQIAGLNNQIADSDKANKTEITALKAEARKGKLHWFGIGYVAGFVSGLLVHVVK